MKLFMDAIWSAVGKEVTGYHHGKPFLGYIANVRTKYDSDLQVIVESEDDLYLIDGSTLYEGGNGIYENLHVYL
jgi:hypothetical protein